MQIYALWYCNTGWMLALRPQRLYRLLGIGGPGRPRRLSHSSWALTLFSSMLLYVHSDHIKDYQGRGAQDGHLDFHTARSWALRLDWSEFMPFNCPKRFWSFLFCLSRFCYFTLGYNQKRISSLISPITSLLCWKSRCHALVTDFIIDYS